MKKDPASPCRGFCAGIDRVCRMLGQTSQYVSRARDAGAAAGPGMLWGATALNHNEKPEKTIALPVFGFS